MRREGPGLQATLNARIIDRQIRPLFPKPAQRGAGHRHGAVRRPGGGPGAAAAIGASAALSISDVPWGGPTACTTVGYVDGNYVASPSMESLVNGETKLELTVAATKDAVLMVEAAATELSEDVMVGAIEFAQEQLAPVVELIERMKSEIGLEKKAFTPAIELTPTRLRSSSAKLPTRTCAACSSPKASTCAPRS